MYLRCARLLLSAHARCLLSIARQARSAPLRARPLGPPPIHPSSIIAFPPPRPTRALSLSLSGQHPQPDYFAAHPSTRTSSRTDLAIPFMPERFQTRTRSPRIHACCRFRPSFPSVRPLTRLSLSHPSALPCLTLASYQPRSRSSSSNGLNEEVAATPAVWPLPLLPSPWLPDEVRF